VLASADVDVLLAVAAVVADVEDLVVGQTADGSLGVGLVRNLDPQGGVALASVTEVLLDGVGVVGEGAGDALGEAAFGLEPLPAVQDLLAGVDPQIAIGEPSLGQRRPGLFGLVGVLQDGDQEPLGAKTSGRARAPGSWSDMPVGQATSFVVMALPLPVL
jgi:hypothetical protein